MTMISRRGVCVGMAAMSWLSGARLSFAQTFPSQQFTLVSGYTPGGLADTAARLVANYLSQAFSQPAIVENRPGANGAIAWGSVARAEPDGYTLLASTGSQIVVLPAASPSLGLDPLKGLTNITTLFDTSYVLWASKDFPAKDVDALVKLATAEPNSVFYGTSGIGGQQHLATELIARELGIKLEPVHYKGGSAMMVDLLGNRIQLGLATPALGMPYFKDGTLHPLMVLGSLAEPGLPGVPTSDDLGMPMLQNISNWYGINGPPGIPDDIAEALNGIMRDSIASPQMQDALKQQSVRPAPVSRAEFQERIAREYKVMQQLAADMGLVN